VGPLQLSFAPLAQTSSYATDCTTLFWDTTQSRFLTRQLTPSGCLNSRLPKCVTLVVTTKDILLLCSMQYKIREDLG